MSKSDSETMNMDRVLFKKHHRLNYAQTANEWKSKHNSSQQKQAEVASRN